MKRRLVLIIAGLAGVLILVGVVTGVRIYQTNAERAAAAIPTADTQQAYQAAVDSWPYPLPSTVALPKLAPAQVAGGPVQARVFISFFYQCAWEDAYLNGPTADRAEALDSLAAWNQLPVSVSSADNSDGSWKTQVLDPALHGQNARIEGDFGNCDPYRKYRATPAHGITIDRPAPPSTSTDTATAPATADLCVGVAGVPCDPNFGPNLTVDHGARKNATGRVTLDKAGHPASYLVAPGDAMAVVAERFGYDISSLWALNCYRHRADGGLYVGDVLNLDKYTISTVGSENGSSTGADAATRKDCLAQTAVPPQ